MEREVDNIKIRVETCKELATNIQDFPSIANILSAKRSAITSRSQKDSKCVEICSLYSGKWKIKRGGGGWGLGGGAKMQEVYQLVIPVDVHHLLTP